jgi:hypothetical protein
MRNRVAIEARMLQIDNAIRGYQNNIAAWNLRMNEFGEQWQNMIAWAQQQVNRAQAERGMLECDLDEVAFAESLTQQGGTALFISNRI